MTGIGPRLKRERVRLKLSQSALGAIGGVETNAQGNYENGLRSPRADYLSRIAEIGVDVSYVITGQIMPMQTGDPLPIDAVDDLNKVISGLHASLHGMSQYLYQMTRLLETRQGTDQALNREQIESLREDAEAISLATVRLIYTTAKLG